MINIFNQPFSNEANSNNPNWDRSEVGIARHQEVTGGANYLFWVVNNVYMKEMSSQNPTSTNSKVDRSEIDQSPTNWNLASETNASQNLTVQGNTEYKPQIGQSPLFMGNGTETNASQEPENTNA